MVGGSMNTRYATRLLDVRSIVVSVLSVYFGNTSIRVFALIAIILLPSQAGSQSTQDKGRSAAARVLTPDDSGGRLASTKGGLTLIAQYFQFDPKSRTADLHKKPPYSQQIYGNT